MKTTLRLSLILATMTLDHAYASGTAVSGVGAKASALQAFTALADDGSAIYYNPAGLPQISSTETKGGVNFIHPDLKYTNSNNNVRSESTRKAIGANLFYVKPSRERWRLGFGLYSPFSRIADYQANAAVQSPLNTANQSSLFLRVDAAPTLAYQVNDQLSIGGSAIISYGKTESDSWGLDEYGNGYGMTGQIGILWQALPSLRIGLNYRGQETIHMTGHGQSTLGTFPGAPIDGRYTQDVKYPATFSAGVAWQITSKWLLSTAYENEMWSYVKEVAREYANTRVVNTLNAKDTNNYRVGVVYTPTSTHHFFCGYSYMKAAVPANNISPAQPDYNTNIAAIGYRYLKNQWRFDVAYEHAFLNKRASQSAAFPGTYQGNNQQLLLDVSYRS